MPYGKGTYGSKVGRPPKKKTMKKSSKKKTTKKKKKQYINIEGVKVQVWVLLLWI